MVDADPPIGDDTPQPAPDAVLARRAQILATEHWGLLAARGTAQSEVLTRITIYLTLVSAGLVTIGLLGQASGFGGWFAGAALAILGFLTLVGLMTLMRVANVAEEDLMYVVAMNRLRGAYVDLDPAVERYFLAGIADDMMGSRRTYSFFRERRFSHLFGSSFVLIGVVDAVVFALLVGSLVGVTGAGVGWAIAIGLVVGTGFVYAAARYAFWTYRQAWQRHIPLRRSAPPPPATPAAQEAEARRNAAAHAPTAPFAGLLDDVPERRAGRRPLRRDRRRSEAEVSSTVDDLPAELLEPGERDDTA